ncbi:MAG: hypothetical protein KA120_02365 [Candidatus Goldbacteria bacterium]|nr:hypothetical protein [Candidatus Goldiibacteriota bacterium]
MNKKTKILYWGLLVSVVFLLIGTFLTVDAYFGIHSVEIAAGQIEFIKNLPYCIDAGQKKKIPLYKEISFLKKHTFVEGYVTSSIYENTSSLLLVDVTLKRPGIFDTDLICLIDMRSRN